MIVESSQDVISISGALRANFWETIQTAVSLTLQRHPAGVIVDCHDITELTEEGAATFQSAIDFVFEHPDARIIFVRVPEHVKEVMSHVPQVRSQMVVMESVEDARKSIDLLTTEEPEKKRERKECNRHILTCLCPKAFDPHVLEVSIELVSSAPAKVVLLMPLVIPREHPLQAHMPELEKQAEEFACKAKQMLSARHVPFEIRLERARDLSDLVVEVGNEVDAAHILVSLPASHEQEESMATDFRSIVKKTDRSILFVRGPIDD